MESDSRRLLEALVVKAVLDGYDTRSAVVERLRSIDPRDVEEAIDRLLAEGALREVEEGLIFKRRRLVVTRRGLERLGEARRLLEEARRGRITLDVDPGLLALALSMLLGVVLVGEALEEAVEASGDEWGGEEDSGDYGGEGFEDLDVIDL